MLRRCALVAVTLAAGCLRDDLVRCGSITCPIGRECDLVHQLCLVPGEPRCGDGIISIEIEETCDDGDANADAPDACRTRCQVPRCGDGIADPSLGETCDDGNVVTGDGCRPDCRSNELCGNGELDNALGEQCDDGNTRAHDGCDSSCSREVARWRRVVSGPSNASVVADIDGPLAAYDARRGVFVMWSYSETYERRSGNWYSAPSTTVGPSAGTTMVYDHARGLIVLVGGGQTWTWDGVTWQRLFGVSSPQHTATQAIYDSGRQRIVAHALSTTLELGPTGAWTTVATAQVPNRVEFAFVYDPTRGRSVVTGGLDGDVSGAIYRSDTWEWDGTTWTERPSADLEAFSAMAFWDTARQAVTHVGGWSSSTMIAWNYELGATWTATAAYGPSAEGAVAHDPFSGRTITYGGVEDPVNPVETNTLRERDDAGWAIVPAVEPGTRVADIVDDTARGCLVLFGGVDALVWEWCQHRWRSVSASGPTARTAPAMAYDAARRRTVVFGGRVSSTVQAETWEWDGSAWHAGPSGPPARDFATMVYDRARGVSVLFGGRGAAGDLGDTWTYDGAVWTQRTGTGPSARARPAIAYDEARQRVVLFGGLAAAGYLADTWEWDGTSWLQLTPLDHPMRSAGAMTYDRDRGTVLYREAAGEVWEWDGQAWRSLEVQNAGPSGDGRFVFHTAERESAAFVAGKLSLLSPRGQVSENCTLDLDVDGDGLRGCADDDCWGRCSSECPPGSVGCTSQASCGDLSCGSLETCWTCPGDCGACAERCGDFRCTASESPVTCPGDCR